MKASIARLLFVLTLVAANTLTFTRPAQAANGITVIHAFSGTYYPGGELVADSSGNLYGTTAFSNDKCGCSTLFKLTPVAGGGWQFRTIYQFPAGQQPQSLILDASGNFYGTTFAGGAYDLGSVFELIRGAGQWENEVLYSFGSTKDDVNSPVGSLNLDAAGNLYGTAETGGASQAYCGGSGCGGVFELTPSGTQWNEVVLYNFTGQLDGGLPEGNLIFDASGNLYGTAGYAGKYNSGVVFELSPSIGGSWTETTLYTFTGGADGGIPESGLIFDSAGNLYGTTYRGGNVLCNYLGCGTVFKLAPQGGNWALSTLFAFDAANGGWPVEDVVFDSAGNLYGTTAGFGKNGQGVVFKLSPDGDNWVESFSSLNLEDGGIPGQLILNNGSLYVTAQHGGGKGPGNGVVLSIQF